jgi:hypothetical protein
MGPLEKEIADYIHHAMIRIKGPWLCAADLKQWYFSQREKDMRASLVITGTTPEHQKLYNAFLSRGNALSTSSHIRDVAE